MLVVDDDESVRELVRLNLELEGFEVATAADGHECLERVADVRPRVVVLDLMMPRLDGWETLSALRGEAETRDLPVLVLTALAMQADVERGARAGVDAYLTKPFDPMDLVATVRRLADG